MGRCKYCGKDFNECKSIADFVREHASCIRKEQELLVRVKRWLSDERGE